MSIMYPTVRRADNPDVTVRRAMPVAVVVALVAFVIDLRLQPGGLSATRDVDDLVQLAAAGIAAGAAGLRASRVRGRLRASWTLLSLATGSWCAGQCVWSYYEVIAQRATPFPSAADVGYLLFPVFALAGVLVRPSRAFDGRGRIRIALDGILVAASLFVLSWSTTLGSVYRAGGDSHLAAVVSLAYPSSDLVLLTVTLIVVSYARSGTRAGLSWVASGLVGLAVADSGFAYLTTVGRYATGNLIDAGWVGGFLVLGLAAVFDPRTTEVRQTGLDATPRSALLLPYLPATLALIDALWQLRAARHTDGPILVACAVVIAMLVVRQVIVLLDNRVLVAKVTHQAFHDELTGLANRALFNDRLAHALDLHRRDLRPLALLLIDLDEFKRVNDTLGHPAGDELLTRVGERLLVTARRGDTVARLGGDEFTILMEDNNDALLVASRLLEALDTPVSIAGRQVTIRASIGITTIRATDPTMSATEMFKQADLALYAAKGAGKAMIATYHPGLDHPEAEADDPNLWDTVPTTAS
jgi:diguanylate cyclase (GGDEF)-like protein